MLVMYMLISNSQGSVTLVWRHSWFCDRALILPSCPVFMWAHSFECARAVRSLVCVPCFMLERGVRIPALMSWVSVSCRGSGTRAPCSVSLWECAVSSSSTACSSVHVCFVVLHAVCVSIGCVHLCYICVARSLCISLAACFHVVMSRVNTWLMSFLISCMFMSCSAHGWWFVCWPCACVFVLCEHMAFVLVFCVPCALMSIVLTPPKSFPDYWLICTTCLSSLPSSFAPFIISLCLQSCASSSLCQPWLCQCYLVLSCLVLSCLVLSCLVLSCLVLSCLVLPCPALPCPALPCPASCPVFLLQGSLFLLLVLFYVTNKKPITLQYWVLASSLLPNLNSN